MFVSGRARRQTCWRTHRDKPAIRGKGVVKESLTNKLVSEVDGNHSSLISAVGKIKARHQSLLLDGHFVLRGDQGGHIPIAEEVFRELRG